MTVNFTKNSHRWGFMLLTILLFCATALRVVAQGPPLNITGVVKDARDGNKLIGVTVTVSGTKGGSVTNTDGTFSVRAAEGANITFSYVGYVPQTVKAHQGQAQLTIVLKLDQKQLNDVVVIGYQQTSRRNVTAAVTSVNPKEMQDIPTPTFDALLQGRAPGLDVQNFSGEPGVRSNVVMRGNTAVSRNINSNMADPNGRASMARALSGPLYVIDGVPQSTEDLAAIAYGDGTNTDVLAGIAINDIEKIDILKDASASAIYGSRGAGGVIIITTKKGVAGRTKVDFTTYHGFTERPHLDKVVIGAEERRVKMALINHYGNWDNLQDIPQILTDSLNTAFNNANDYLGQMYQTGYVGDYNLSITGGGDKVTYRYGLDYYNEEGIVKKSGLKRYAFNSSIGLNLAKNLTLNTQIRYYRLDRPRSMNESTGSYAAFDGGYYANSYLPTSLLYLTPANQEYIFGDAGKSTDGNVNNNLSISPILNWNISKHFSFNTTLSYTVSNSRRDTYIPSTVRRDGTGEATSFEDNSFYYLMYNTLQYTTAFGKDHHFNVLVGQNTEYSQYRMTQASAIGIPNDQIHTVTVVDKNLADTRTDLLQSGIQTGFLRANYSFKDRYLLSGVFNADASSRFGSDNRWGYFPSLSVGWIISDEPFMKQYANWLTLLKLRGSFGVNGAQPDGGDMYLAYNTYDIANGSFSGSSSPVTGNNMAYTYNGVPSVALNYNAGLTNNKLSWAKTKQYNVGLDVTLLDGRFNFVGDAYVKQTTGGIFTLSVPVTTGYSTVTANAIGIRNTGVEAQFIANYFRPQHKFQWQTILNLSHNDNIVTDLPNGGRDIYLDKYLLRRGHALNSYNVFKQTGIYRTDKDVPFNPVTAQPSAFYGYPFKGGDPIWQDTNGDGVLDNTDYIIAGDPNPKVSGGLSNVFSYKGFTLNIFCVFTAGRTIYNDYLAGKLSQLVPTDDDNSNPYHSLSMHAMPDLSGINYWQNPGDNAQYPSLSSVSGTRYKYAAVSSNWLEKGDYFRVKNVSLSYSLPSRVVDHLHMKRIRIYTMLDNVYIWQASHNVPDAEEVNAFGVYSGSGYPVPKKYTMGLDISL